MQASYSRQLLHLPFNKHSRSFHDRGRLLRRAPLCSRRPLLVNLAPVRDPCDAHQFRRVVDDVHDAPVTDPDAPLVFVAFELFASCGAWRMG